MNPIIIEIIRYSAYLFLILTTLVVIEADGGGVSYISRKIKGFKNKMFNFYKKSVDCKMDFFYKIVFFSFPVVLILISALLVIQKFYF